MTYNLNINNMEIKRRIKNMNIAWIGTGVMGSSMAKNLAENGYNVYAFSRTTFQM